MTSDAKHTDPVAPHAGTTTTSPRFLSFLAAQFLGAANDNAFKITLMLLILARVQNEATQLRLNSVVTLLFPLPFLLFSPLAGYLADRFRKSRFLAISKSPEILAMALSIPALASGNLVALLGVLFLMSMQSAFFSPVKYGLLPESMSNRDLSMANGLLQMTTNLAILVGTVAGMFAFGRFRETPTSIGIVYLGVAVAGTLFATYVPHTPPGRRDTPVAWNVLTSAVRDWREARRQPVLFQTILGIAFFGFLGALFLTLLPVYARNTLALSEIAAGSFMVILSLGIACGSLVAGKLSHHKVEIGLVPLGCFGMAVLSIVLGGFGHLKWNGEPVVAWAAVAGLGVAAGFYVVPLNALLQQRSPDGMKGRLIAFSNVLTFSAVLLAAGLPPLLTLAGLDTRQIVIVAGVMNLAVAVYIVSLLPEFTVRLVLLLVVRVFYRVQVDGLENIPRTGAIFVANHISWVDALLIGTSSDRIPRFMMFRPFYETKALNWFFKRMHVIPVSKLDSDEQKEASLELAREQIRQGHVVCIFAEGAISRTGNLLKFRRGFERIAQGANAPIVPVYLDGVWGSVFSWEQGKLLFKWPRHHADPVRVMFGRPLPSTTHADEVRRAVAELTVRAFELRKERQRPLAVELMRTARRFWRRPFVTDGTGRQLRFGEALTQALDMRAALFGNRADRRGDIGLLLHPGVPATLANIATACAGRTLVNLDFDASDERLARQIAATKITRVLTSRDLLASLPGQAALAGVDILVVEDLPRSRRPVTALACRWLPSALTTRWFVWGDRDDVDQPAAVVFSASTRLTETSGGVVLSHHNVLSNLESLKQVFRISREDRILGVIPFWNAFGLTGTLLLPAIAGVRVAYHDPDDLGGIDRFARDRKITVLPLPAWKIDAFTERLSPEALANLRYAVVAGGLLTPAQRTRFADRFGVEPLEGFGTPECAPLVSLNFPQIVRDARGQRSHRPGTSGQTLPGVAARIVDPATGAERTSGHFGVLEVKGPNVMQGYLGEPDLTTSVLDDGWYRTEFLALLDPDGFLTVLGFVDDGIPASARRPRDRFGRPLPAGSADDLGAVEPERVVRGPGEALARARALFDEQRFFEAHEFFEYLWKSPLVPDADRGFWRGLTQVAAGYCHLQRGNDAGARSLLERALTLVGNYPSEFQGIDTSRLIDDTRRSAASLTSGDRPSDPPFPNLPVATEETRP